ncbi:M13 family metallopeptidase [Acinetobacter vivianii]|uniref:M13 family metallopeptidase n=1 Tax=Acinetobacter vivianii TaxID=1776742 RepID=UPI002DB71D74|nr:M13 family metallopeptidase [Acinetobacter vivianii]MEB6480249.1 M13 family metallopeptidase [Acinetobacter vivianii]MEB6658696.1 M13 family metallopeptidase [Acinetobacter vivianii]
MKPLLLKSALAVALTATTINVWAAQAIQSAQTQKISGIDQQYIDQNGSANNDFYDYVNGTWLKQTEIPADKARWGAFNELHELSTNQLHRIVEDLTAQKWAAGSVEQKIASLYASFMDEKAIEAKGIQPLQPELARVDALQSKQGFAQLMGHFSRIGVRTPFDISIGQDMKRSDVMIAGLVQRRLGLPDRDYYLKDDQKFVETRAKYLKHIERMLQLSGDQQAAQHAKEILTLETKLAKIQWSNVQNRDLSKRYNIYKTKDLKKLTSTFDWNTYLNSVGVKDKIQTIQVNQLSYFQSLDPVIQRTPLNVWKAYFKWNLISSFAPYLNKAFVDESFAFYGNTLRDVAEQQVRWKRGVQIVNGVLGDGLGKIYVDKHFSADKKQRMDALVQNLIQAYDQSISQLDWMSPETKVQAKKKLSSLSIKVGYPKKWRDYSALDIKDGDLVGNVIRASEFEHQDDLDKLGKPVDRDEWFMTPQTVNAYYNPSSNEIVFPAAILQPPFFNIDADDAVNYGGIGSVIGHEISHGFDDQGSQFDELGNMRNWWTAQDHKRFKAKTQALVAQYNAYEPIAGYHVNGELTLGENIADNSGLSIAYKAYQISLAGKPAPVIEGRTGEQRFYMGWAQVWRAKTREAQAIVYLKTDPHSPDKVRANGALVNQAPFYDAFKIKEGDKIYLAPEKRVSIW